MTSYKLTDDELKAFIRIKKSLEPSYRPFFESQSTDSLQEKNINNPSAVVPGPIHWPGYHESSENTLADCLSWDEMDVGRKSYRFGFNQAECKLPGHSGDFTLNCSATYTTDPSPFIRKSQPFIFDYHCPFPKVCIDMAADPALSAGHNTLEGGPKNIACRPEEDLVVKQHAAIALQGARSSAVGSPDWCSLPEIVPGLDYPPTWKTTSFMLTEEVSWANGSQYKAPKLWIKDSPTHYKYGFDRGLRRNTNVISTIVNVESWRGHLQSRAVNFCMEMIRGGNVWTVMMYTWFKYTPRRGSVPARIDYIQHTAEPEN